MEIKYNEEQKQRAYNWREKNRKKYNEISKKSYENVGVVAPEWRIQ